MSSNLLLFTVITHMTYTIAFCKDSPWLKKLVRAELSLYVDGSLVRRCVTLVKLTDDTNLHSPRQDLGEAGRECCYCRRRRRRAGLPQGAAGERVTVIKLSLRACVPAPGPDKPRAARNNNVWRKGTNILLPSFLLVSGNGSPSPLGAHTSWRHND